MVASYRTALTENRRGYILRILDEAGGACNETVLRDACRAGFQPHGVTRDLIRDDIEWLRRHGCIVVEWVDETLALPRLTERGRDTAGGHLVINGVSLPAG